MRLSELRIQNFRPFKDETIRLDNYNCFVGPNGAGKSAVLTALNVFFRNTASAATDLVNLSEEDFHNKNTAQPIIITLTLEDLSDEAQEDLSHYYRQGKLIVSSKAVWQPEKGIAEVKQYGSRLVMKDFKPYFAKDAEKASAKELKQCYNEFREKFDELPSVTSKGDMEQALRDYEESHPELCSEEESETQFYGWSKGAGLLSKYIQWVYVPAVKDASTEQEEGSKTALGQLLSRTIRSTVNFEGPIATLKADLETQYKQILDGEQQALDGLRKSIEQKLQNWVTGNARLGLEWNYDRNKSIVVNEPTAKVSLGDGGFLGEVARVGHGLQRAFIVALLQEMAHSQGDAGPRLLLGFEEPELYQHPPQARHFSGLLEELADDSSQKTQVLVTTHSPYFVSSKGFECVRLVRQGQTDKHTTVTHATYDEVGKRLADALGEEPKKGSVVMSQVEQIMQPSQNELYFSPVAVLVEGTEDVAHITTHLKLSGKWAEFRRLGCHFIVCGGKSPMSRPLAIAKELSIPAFVVFDADSDSKPDNHDSHRRDNGCLLNLCGAVGVDSLPSEVQWGSSYTVWPTKIADTVIQDVGKDAWQNAEDAARATHEMQDGVRRKNNLLISATMEQLYENGVSSSVLDKLCSAIMTMASNGNA